MGGPTFGLLGLSNDWLYLDKAAAEGNEIAKLALNAFAYRIQEISLRSSDCLLVKSEYPCFYMQNLGQHSVLMCEMITKNLDISAMFLTGKRTNSSAADGE